MQVETCGASQAGVAKPFDLQREVMQRKALVVDDSMLVRHTICRFLEERGFVAEPVTNAREAIQMAAELKPTVIVTDLNLHHAGGEELMAKLKSSPATASIPVIALTSRRAAPLIGPRPEFLIYKDIDVARQLDRALAALG
jgi:CheY-like chemotaxis protein